jgi:hypothetical protein
MCIPGIISIVQILREQTGGGIGVFQPGPGKVEATAKSFIGQNPVFTGILERCIIKIQVIAAGPWHHACQDQHRDERCPRKTLHEGLSF